MNIFNETHDVTRRSWDYNVILVVVLFGFSFSWLYVVFSYSFSSNVLRSVSFMIIRWITVFRPVWAEFVNELSLLRDGYLELPSYVSESRSKILRLWPPPRQKLCDQSGLSDSHSVCLSVCLCVCEQDYCKSNQPISLKLGVMIGPTNRKNWLHFGSDPVTDTDSGSLFSSFTIAE